jgi:hypothetical protein
MFTLNCKGRLLVINKPIVMGILNSTPDSFYTASRLQTEDAVLQQADAMLKDGATILDVGGQSTRPGSERITAEEEAARVLPAIELISKNFPDAFISVDTYYAAVGNAGSCCRRMYRKRCERWYDGYSHAKYCWKIKCAVYLHAYAGAGLRTCSSSLLMKM